MPGCQVAQVTFVRVPTPGLGAADKGMMVIILGQADTWWLGTRANVTRATWHPGICLTRASVPRHLGTREKETRDRVGASQRLPQKKVDESSP